MTPFNPHTAAKIAAALESTGPHSYYPTDEECRQAAAQLRAAIGEVERLAEVCRKWEDHFTGTPGIAAANAEIICLRAEVEKLRDEASHPPGTVAKLRIRERATSDENAELRSQRDSALAAVARLTEENKALRDAVLCVCDSHIDLALKRHHVRAIRAAANYLGKPFSIPAVERYAEDDHDNSSAWCQNLAADCADRDEGQKELVEMLERSDAEARRVADERDSLAARLAEVEAECERMRAVAVEAALYSSEFGEDASALDAVVESLLGAPICALVESAHDTESARRAISTALSTTSPENKP